MQVLFLDLIKVQMLNAVGIKAKEVNHSITDDTTDISDELTEKLLVYSSTIL